MFSQHKSLSGKMCATVFASGARHLYVRPMDKKRNLIVPGNRTGREIKEQMQHVCRLKHMSKMFTYTLGLLLQYSSKAWLCTEYNAKNQQGRTGYELITGNTPNISEWIQSNVTKLCGSKMKYYLGLKKESIKWIGIPTEWGKKGVISIVQVW